MTDKEAKFTGVPALPFHDTVIRWYHRYQSLSLIGLSQVGDVLPGPRYLSSDIWGVLQTLFVDLDGRLTDGWADLAGIKSKTRLLNPRQGRQFA